MVGRRRVRYPTATMTVSADLEKRTHVYKRVDGVDVALDLYRPAGSGDRLPLVVWIHGGALIMGSRIGTVPPWLLAFCREQGVAVASIDYRLAPQVTAPAIVEDVRDAFTWLRGRVRGWPAWIRAESPSRARRPAAT